MSEARQFKDYQREAHLFWRRVLLAAIVVLLLLGVLLYRFYSLQVVHFDNYTTLSERNRVHVLPIPPTRGLIYDRHGELLAENRPSYTLSVVQERVPDLAETLTILSRLISVTPTDIEKFYDQLRQRRRPFDAVPLRFGLTEEEIARLAVNEYRLDGVEVEAQLVRHYPHGELFAHTVGYVGRISERELSGFDADEHRRYSGTHSIGKIGLERYYESALLGEVGYQHVETNARGRVLRVLERNDPSPGEDLVLHLDAGLQREVMEGLEGKRAAVVAIDVATGGVLAAVSAPSFDANLFVTGISFRDYRELNQSLDLPLFNRFLQGQYPPGSTLKPVVALGGLHHDIITPEYTVYDPGFYRLKNDSRLYRDWKRQGHGAAVDLKQAIAESCDVYFYDLGFNMGIDLMHSMGAQFGLGELTQVDLPSERRGLWPSREWKRGARGMPWFPGDSLNVSIGQGDVLTTPMQLAVMTATLANKGMRMQPQLASRLGDQPVVAPLAQQIEVEDSHWQAVLEAMAAVMHSPQGTAQRLGRNASFRMAGKTGTAQVVAIPQGERYDSEALQERHRDHALFVGFAPLENPKVAVAVLLENAESSSAAGAIALRVFEYWLAQEENTVTAGED